jgi:membrane fusion protein (multidrug efflux system)
MKKNMEQPIHPKKIREQRNLRLRLVTFIILGAAIVAGVYWWEYTQHWVSTNDAYVTGNLVTLKAQTSGIVVEVRAENTQSVQKGEVLVRLDGVPAQLALEQAKAELADSVRRIAAQFNQVEVLKQRVVVQQATLTRVQHDRERYRQAAAEGGVSAQQLQNAEDQAREIEAGVQQTQAELKSLNTLIQGTTAANHPTVQKAKEALKRAYLEYVRKDIVAPVSGYVAKRRAQVGEQVQPGAPLLAIVPLDYLWVEANVKETDLARIRPGQPAEIRIDAYGGELVYQGVVEGLNPGTGSVFSLLPPENAAGNYIHIVERVPIRIALSKDELKEHPLRPGLSTVTRIDITEPGDSVLESATTTEEAIYRTDVYARELGAVDELINAIVETNLAGGG